MSFSVLPILNQIATFYSLRAYNFKIRCRRLFSHTGLSLPIALFPSGFTTAISYYLSPFPSQLHAYLLRPRLSVRPLNVPVILSYQCTCFV